jgi:hypothetical protein
MKHFILLMLVIILGSCSALPSPEPTRTALPTSSPSPTSTTQPTATAALIPTSTATKSPTSTITPFPTPFSLPTREDLQKALDEWLAYDMDLFGLEFTDEDRLLDEHTGELMPLGVVNRAFDDVTFLFYNLGYFVLYDDNNNGYLVNLVGFEDPQGNRFTFVFHNGRLSDNYNFLFLTLFEGRTFNKGRKITSFTLTTLEFGQRAQDITFRVNCGHAWEDVEQYPSTDPNEVAVDGYIASAKKTTRALASFLECADCSVESPYYGMIPFMNVIPEQFNPEMPFLRMYSVGYWEP